MRYLHLLLTFTFLTQFSKGYLFSQSYSFGEIDSLNKVAGSLTFADPDSARNLASELVVASERNNYPLQAANALHTIAVTYHIEGEFDKAILEYKKTIDLRNNTEDHYKIAGVINNIASIYSSKADFTRALELYQIALVLKQETNDELGVSNTLNNIGIIHYENKDFEKAIQYYQKGLDIRLKIGELRHAAASYGNIGLTYLDEGNYEKSIDFYQKGLDLLPEEDDLCYQLHLLDGLGTAYLGLEKIDTAEKYSRIAYEQAIICENIVIQSTALNTLGRINTVKGNYHLAEKQLKEAYGIAEEHSLYAELSELTRSLYEFYKLTESPKNALVYFEEYHVLVDSLESREVAREIIQLEMKYLFQQEKDSIRFVQEEELRSYAAENEHQSIIQNYTYVLLGLSLLIAFLLCLGYFRNKKINGVLSEKNEIITRALNEKEMLIREIHHRVKNNLQIINSMLNIQRKTTPYEQTREQLENAQNRLLAMSLVHDSLYKSKQINEIDSSLYLVDLIETLEKALCASNIQLVHTIEKIPLTSELAISIGLLLNELITNACKHAFPDNEESGRIDVNLREENSAILLQVNDNGIGFDDKIVKAAFGLKIVRSLIKSLNSDATILNENGTKIRIEIPTT